MADCEGDDMYCSHCGKKLSEDDFFCSNCGTRVEREDIWNGDESDAFDETMLYDPKETIEAMGESKASEAAPFVARNKDEERWYGRNSSARAARRLSAKRNNGVSAAEPPLSESEVEAVEAPAEQPLKPGFKGFSAAVGGVFAGIRGKKEATPLGQEQVASNTVDEQPYYEVVAEPDGSEDEGSLTSFRGLFVGVILIGIVIGIVLGLFAMRPQTKTEDVAPAATPTAAVVQMVDVSTDKA